MIHSLQAVRLAQEERVRCTITDPHSKRDAESAAMDVARGLRGLIREVYGIDALPIHFVMNLAHDLDGERVEGRWSPSTNAITVLGGPEDGALYSLRGAPCVDLEVMEAVQPIADWTSPAKSQPTSEVDTGTAIYRASGWSDTQHAWVYSRA